MKQLDPKAVWLFFIGSFMRVVTWGMIPAIYISMTGFLAEDIVFREGIQFDLRKILFLAVIILIIYIIFSYIWARLSYRFYRYELREDGFRKEHGVIFKKYVTIPYDRIQNVDIYRGIFARFLGLSDLQIQTAGGITAGSYGAFSEGRLPGVSKKEAEVIRDELIRRAKQSKNQGL